MQLLPRKQQRWELYAVRVFRYTTLVEVSQYHQQYAVWVQRSGLLAKALHHHPGEWWYRNTLIGLLLALERVFRLVGHALHLKDEYIAALAARNGLELKVWVLYATSSEGNARRLHDDQIVDVRDVLRRLNDLRKLVPASDMPSGLDAEVDVWNQGMAQKATEFTVTEQDNNPSQKP